jgi:DNA-binding NarL/FixJ family response regulator
MPTRNPIRLILVDDHPIVLHGLRQLCERQPDFEVVACCQNGREALDAVRNVPADVLVLDLRMPEPDGLSVLRELKQIPHTCRVVVLTASVDDQETAEVVQLGAMGLVLKESAPDVVMTCIRRVHSGVPWMDQGTLTRAFEQMVRTESAARDAAQVLTGREIEIVRLVAEGLRNRDIATRLAISEGTVKIHLHNVYEKLRVDGRLEMVLTLQQRGWV